MKNARKLVVAAMALTMVSAVAPLSVFAADDYTVTPDGVKLNGEATDSPPAMKATLDVPMMYTVTIPASVSLSATENKSALFSVTDVMLKKGQKIKVKLAEAEFITTGDSTFQAKTQDRNSTATFTIGKGEEKTGVSVGDVVAEFDKEDTAAKKITFSPATGNTFAGAHTETLTFSIAVEDAAPANPYAAAKVGDVVSFGNYDWYVIDKRDDGVTLLMKESFTNKKYNDSDTDVTWENCTLRAYLNGEFYNSFSAEDKAKIVETSNTNPNNGSTPGGNDTKDHIYLLSIGEANALDSSIRANGSWWWLRSPGAGSNSAATVYDYGKVSVGGSSDNSTLAVRPALNLKF